MRAVLVRFMKWPAPLPHGGRVQRQLEDGSQTMQIAVLGIERHEGSPSGIPSFYTVLYLEVVCHDLFGSIILFQQRGFHRAVIALAATGFVLSPIEYG